MRSKQDWLICLTIDLSNFIHKGKQNYARHEKTFIRAGVLNLQYKAIDNAEKIIGSSSGYLDRTFNKVIWKFLFRNSSTW